MKRRTFFRRMFGSLGAAAAGAPLGDGGRSVLIQECRIAGFQFHSGDAVWSSLAVGVPLSLVREAANEHDSDAVAVHFEDQKLGYVPRGENTAIAQMLDRGETLEASITKLRIDEDPWERVRMSVSVV